MDKPSIVVNHDKSTSLRLKNIQELILWCYGDGVNPSWILVRNRTQITKIVLIMIPDLTPSLLPPTTTEETKKKKKKQELYQQCSLLSSDAWYLTLLIPKDGRIRNPPSVQQQLFETKLSKEEKIEREQNLSPKESFSLTHCLLTNEEMIQNLYPVDEGTKQEPIVYDASCRVYAMDCEMCMTGDGLQLTRISLLDYETEEVVLDSYVQTQSPVTDYLTEYSGVKEEHLLNAPSFEQIQLQVKQLLNIPCILIGHSLENDLLALQISHPYIIDTSVLYGMPHSSYKPKLKYLAQKYLQLSIQSHPTHGHCSIEDARTCLRLVKLKLQKGKEFGLPSTKSLFARLSEKGKTCGLISSSSQYCKEVTYFESSLPSEVRNQNCIIIPQRWEEKWERLLEKCDVVVGELPSPIENQDHHHHLSVVQEQVQTITRLLPENSLLLVCGYPHKKSITTISNGVFLLKLM